ncbi:hypothetical protein CRD60_04625 [Bifidobacterium aemilianum]|uniref:Molecular chaperone n=1 Tax=Bifidobacterium aemilianum TaxID=2493120 RepID=A0A366K9F4_9BIFI|nr:hypothetical protein CRD60_04625 [Bifidobacterium aemilianum]
MEGLAAPDDFDLLESMHAGTGLAETAAVSDRPRFRWMIVVCLVSVLVGLAGAWAFAAHRAWSGREHVTALESCNEARASAQSGWVALKQAVKGIEGALSVSSDQVEDSQTVSTLHKLASSLPSGPSASCTQEASVDQLRSSATASEKQMRAYRSLADRLSRAARRVGDSREAKELSISLADLDSSLERARTLLTASAGNVTDDQTRVVLQQAIDDAVHARNAGKPARNAIEDARSSVEKAMQGVSESQAAKEDQQASAAEAAGGAPPPAPVPAPSPTPRAPQRVPSPPAPPSGDGGSPGWSVPAPNNGFPGMIPGL